MRRSLPLAALSVALSASPALAFSASFSWHGIPACASVSPAFTIAGAPSGTAALRFMMRDRDAPDFQHGGSTVDWTPGHAVPRGAITYTGPCPPDGSHHRYIWTIEALDRNGGALGSAQAERPFPER